MCEPFNNRKTAVWLIGLALAAGAALWGNPARAAHYRRGKPVLSGNITGHARPLGRYPVGITGSAKPAPGANGSTRKPAPGEPPTGTGSASKLRDPFKAPEPPPTASSLKTKRSHLPAVLPPGDRGLVIDQLILEGVVDKKPDNAMIAVVTNKTNRAYFLRVNEQVFDGTVTMITPGAIFFRQRFYSDDDKAEWRTVEKRLSPGPGGKK
ncbi:MAG TPA: hypothetical protein VMX16_05730 [Terriglobia bacterium]|nr:hypothetical protein [Terriglobia bacterium]